MHTREARLELLDPQPSRRTRRSPTCSRASIEPLAEGPDQVKAQVQEILGLTYEHFTQSVLLPQGRFSEFLHAKAADRQDLLVELLAFGVYKRSASRPASVPSWLPTGCATAQAAAGRLADATRGGGGRAAARVQALAELASGSRGEADGPGAT